MRAVAIEKFGGPETIAVCNVPVPNVGPNQVLVRVEAAGVGDWDVFEREGMFAQMFGTAACFPHVLGSEGAGTIAAVGIGARDRFRIGERVYGLILMRSPKGGFFAEYAAVDANLCWPLPGRLSAEQAGAMPVDAGTALRGLRDVLRLRSGQSVMIFGASGGIGHMAVQLAKRMGVRVLAVASREDGVALATRLGADMVVEGYTVDVIEAARGFSRQGLDAALFTAGGPAATKALRAVRKDGLVAYPNGVEPLVDAPAGVRVQNYDAGYDTELMEHLNRLIGSGPFEVHVARVFELEDAAEALRALESHYVGRLALRPLRARRET
jgi:NADPH:quinone reductase-like Zn-dependent oxidoreductase